MNVPIDFRAGTATSESIKIRHSAAWTDGSFFFNRLLSAAGAPVLTRLFTSASPGRHTVSAPFPLRLQLPPVPARFFFCPQRPKWWRAAENVRGLRLAWLLGVNRHLV